MVVWTPTGLETPMVLGQPPPFVRPFGAAVDDAIRASHPSHTMCATQRAGRACCVTAGLVTHSIGRARLARASLGTSSLAALSWMLRPRKMPWDKLLVARVRVSLRHHSITSGTLVIDDPDHSRSQSATERAYLSNLRAGVTQRFSSAPAPGVQLHVLGN
jgi:hypothetical protein